MIRPKAPPPRALTTPALLEGTIPLGTPPLPPEPEPPEPPEPPDPPEPEPPDPPDPPDPPEPDPPEPPLPPEPPVGPRVGILKVPFEVNVGPPVPVPVEIGPTVPVLIIRVIERVLLREATEDRALEARDLAELGSTAVDVTTAVEVVVWASTEAPNAAAARARYLICMVECLREKRS